MISASLHIQQHKCDTDDAKSSQLPAAEAFTEEENARGRYKDDGPGADNRVNDHCRELTKR